MNREQGRLFLEGIKKINIKQSPSFNLLSTYNIDNLLILAGCYYLYTKSTSYISNISIYSIIKKIPYVRRYINTKVNGSRLRFFKTLLKSEIHIIDQFN